MVAAIWSMPFNKAKEMPLKFFLNFFTNHGLFEFKNRPQWYTVSNRSRAYVKNNKYWAPVARVDNVFGDRNLVCSCPSMDEYKDEAA